MHPGGRHSFSEHAFLSTHPGVLPRQSGHTPAGYVEASNLTIRESVLFSDPRPVGEIDGRLLIPICAFGKELLD